MILQRTPNSWSCLVAAFATVLEQPIAYLVEQIGHDGSEILRPNLQDPDRRRGFHIQEMVDYCLSMGYSVTPIEALPQAQLEGDPRIHTLCSLEQSVRRFTNHIRFHEGVFTGKTTEGRPHAVVWNGREISDPKTGLLLGAGDFQIQVFWRIDRRAEQS